MRKNIAFLTILCTLPFAGLPAVAQTAGVTAAVNPTADRTPPGQTPRAVVLGDNIVSNERIETGGDGLVQILLADGTTFTVGPNSSITIDRFVYDPNAGTAEVTATMTRGVFRFIGGRTSKTEGGVRLNTPVGTVGIRGGMVDINLSPTQADLLAHFDLLFGNEVTLDGPGGQQRVYSSGYSVWVNALGRANVSKTPPEWRSRVLQSLAGRPGGTGGSPNRPTDTTVASRSTSNEITDPPQTQPPAPQQTNDQYVNDGNDAAPRYSGEFRGFAAGVSTVSRQVFGHTVTYRAAARNRDPDDVTTTFGGTGGPFQGKVGVRTTLPNRQTNGTVGGISGPSAFIDNNRFGGLGLADGAESYMISGRSGNSDIPALDGFDLCSNCDFLQWGWWGGNYDHGSYQTQVIDGTWVTGDITTPDQLAASTLVSATYSGNAVGTMMDGSGINPATGAMDMTWNFGSGSGNLSISDFGGKDFSYKMYQGPGETFSGAGVGFLSAGSTTGAFVNDGDDIARGVIGNFEQYGIGWTATGVYGGIRD